MAKVYKLIPSKVFLKDLEKLTVDLRPKVEKALLELKKDPHLARSVKKLANVDVGVFRYRIGNYRLRYDVVDDEIRLHVLRHRKDVYKKK